MTRILKSPLLVIINSLYSERFCRALGVHYSKRALYFERSQPGLGLSLSLGLGLSLSLGLGLGLGLFSEALINC